MENANKHMKIKIIKNGPYIVTGNVPLFEKIIVQNGNKSKFKEGRVFPQRQEYALCRCGKSKDAPFCDGTHESSNFKGMETASKENYEERAELIEGPELDLLDDHRCALARFCHRAEGSVWELLQKSDDPKLREEAIQGAIECPTGRLVPIDKLGKVIEPEYEPAIEVIQDEQKGVSGGLFVKGSIPIESSDGEIYEIRNRVVLCRCGRSRKKPFCDAAHIIMGYVDK